MGWLIAAWLLGFITGAGMVIAWAKHNVDKGVSPR